MAEKLALPKFEVLSDEILNNLSNRTRRQYDRYLEGVQDLRDAFSNLEAARSIEATAAGKLDTEESEDPEVIEFRAAQKDALTYATVVEKQMDAEIEAAEKTIRESYAERIGQANADVKTIADRKAKLIEAMISAAGSAINTGEEALTYETARAEVLANVPIIQRFIPSFVGPVNALPTKAAAIAGHVGTTTEDKESDKGYRPRFDRITVDGLDITPATKGTLAKSLGVSNEAMTKHLVNSFGSRADGATLLHQANEDGQIMLPDLIVNGKAKKVVLWPTVKTGE